MRFLFDNNLAPRLVSDLAGVYPNSLHVSSLGLNLPDTDIWNYARIHNHIIVSKDAGFHQRSLLYGPPPKVIWIRLGNCSTEMTVALLRTHKESIEQFVLDDQAAFLAIG